MVMSNDDWTQRIFYHLGLKPTEDWYENSEKFCEKASEIGINSVELYHVIYKHVTTQIQNELTNQGVDLSSIISNKKEEELFFDCSVKFNV